MQQRLTLKEIAQNALDYHEAGLLGAQLSGGELNSHQAACCYIYNDGKHRCAIGASFSPPLIDLCKKQDNLNYGLTVHPLVTGSGDGRKPILDLVGDVGVAMELQNCHDLWARSVMAFDPPEEIKDLETLFLNLVRKIVAEN